MEGFGRFESVILRVWVEVWAGSASYISCGECLLVGFLSSSVQVERKVRKLIHDDADHGNAGPSYLTSNHKPAQRGPLSIESVTRAPSSNILDDLPHGIASLGRAVLLAGLGSRNLKHTCSIQS